ncbi:MAG: winged helix-turn-helix transcriptional regulator [Chloroflexi bacterium]|jgi:predicted ArsR family transcriptional regulator|nr:winged helix-turn-helix transcriptional regulator [Chloroflexota bacterium]
MLDSNAKSTRQKVLQTLLKKHRCSIVELADAVEINPISVRHHIAKLQADGLVVSDEERHGVGRPRQVFYLTESGLEEFPTRYLRLTIRLLEQLKQTLPPKMVDQLFSQMAADLVEEYAHMANQQGMTIEQRLELVNDLLKDEGFDLEWEKKDNQYFIRETSCPYLRVGQNHPEVCIIDQTLISTVLDLPIEKVKCILDGDNQCTYVVPDNTTIIPTEELP